MAFGKLFLERAFVRGGSLHSPKNIQKKNRFYKTYLNRRNLKAKQHDIYYFSANFCVFVFILIKIIVNYMILIILSIGLFYLRNGSPFSCFCFYRLSVDSGLSYNNHVQSIIKRMLDSNLAKLDCTLIAWGTLERMSAY